MPFDNDYSGEEKVFDRNDARWFGISYWTTVIVTIWTAFYYLSLPNINSSFTMQGEPYTFYKKHLSWNDSPLSSSDSSVKDASSWIEGLSPPDVAYDDDDAILWFHTMIFRFQVPFLFMVCLSTLLATSKASHTAEYDLGLWLHQVTTKIANLASLRFRDQYDNRSTRSDQADSAAADVDSKCARFTCNETMDDDTRTEEQRFVKNQYGCGDTNMKLIFTVLVVMPALTVLCRLIPSAYRISARLYDDRLNNGPNENDNSYVVGLFTILFVKYVSYSFGWMSVVLLSFFLIPVSRHSVVLVTLNWNPVHALLIHRWLGYLSFICASLHGLLLFAIRLLRDDDVNNNTFSTVQMPKHYQSFFYSNEWIPSKYCWIGASEVIDTSKPSCKDQWHNLTGILALSSFTVICITSLPVIRRKCYRVFYTNHMIFGCLFLVGAVCHVKYIMLYLLPSILYYFATTVPAYIQAFTSYMRGGIRITRIVRIPQSNDTIEIHASIDTATNQILKNHPNYYVKLCIPQISYIWHPFTVYQHPNESANKQEDKKVRILIQPTGYFTKEISRLSALNSTGHSSLATSCTRITSAATLPSSTSPTTLIDGLYRGSDRGQLALERHDHVAIVAGGVAITPYLSLIPFLLRELHASQKTKLSQPRLRSISLIWTCRHPGLLRYIAHNYLINFIEMATEIDSEFNFQIKLFCTAPNAKRFIDIPLLSMTDSDATNTTPIVVATTNDPVVANCLSSSASSEFEKQSIVSGRSNGHLMELCHIMPGKYPRMIENLPFFMFYLLLICVSHYYTFLSYRNNFANHSLDGIFQDLSRLGRLLLLFVIFGCLMELIHYWRRLLKLRTKENTSRRLKKQGKEANDRIATNGEAASLLENDQRASSTFYGTSVLMPNHSVEDVEEQQRCCHRKTQSVSSQLQANVGRPDIVNDILMELNQASTPGIFMCGPNCMIRSIRDEAKKEYLTCGFTRYALYEESFEM